MGFRPSTSTDLILRPTMSRSRSRRNTSISGSSGTLAPLLQTRPGHPCGGLLGFLLRISLAVARRLAAEQHGRKEPLGVIRPLVAHDVTRAAERQRRRELLQARL